jgi:hypothetical protein
VVTRSTGTGSFREACLSTSPSQGGFGTHTSSGGEDFATCGGTITSLRRRTGAVQSWVLRIVQDFKHRLPRRILVLVR